MKGKHHHNSRNSTGLLHIRLQHTVSLKWVSYHGRRAVWMQRIITENTYTIGSFAKFEINGAFHVSVELVFKFHTSQAFPNKATLCPTLRGLGLDNGQGKAAITRFLPEWRKTQVIYLNSH